MGLFEGKSPAERNKIIIAIVLGTLAVISLTYTFGGIFFPSKQTATTASTTPSPNASETPAPEEVTEIARLPEQNAIDNEYASIPISYLGSNAFSVPVTGRNIFAFWEPGDPTPVPFRPPPTPPTPTPFVPPTPREYNVFLSFVTPQSVYAGSKKFRLEVNGDKFRPDSRIVFNGAPLPTTFISPQRLSAEVPESLISRPYTGSIMVDTPGTEFYSRQIAFNVQDPPKPQFEYIGMIARRHYNNDTAYFQEKGSTSGDPFSARLNDIVQGRFRVISISSKEVEFQDTQLGFRHKLQLLRPAPGTAGGASPSGYDDGGDGNDGGFTIDGSDSSDNPPPVTSIPGIPDNIRRATPRPRPNNPTNQQDQKIDPDDIEPPS